MPSMRRPGRCHHMDTKGFTCPKQATGSRRCDAHNSQEERKKHAEAKKRNSTREFIRTEMHKWIDDGLEYDTMMIGLIRIYQEDRRCDRDLYEDMCAELRTCAFWLLE